MFNLNSNKKIINFENEYFSIKDISFKNHENTDFITRNDDIYITLVFDFKNDISGISFEIFIKTDEDVLVFTHFTKKINIKKGIVEAVCTIPKNLLNNSIYKINKFM